MARKKLGKGCLFERPSFVLFFLYLRHIDHVGGNSRLPCRSLVSFRQDLFYRLHGVSEVADVERDAAQGCGCFGLRFLDLDLRELLLKSIDLVLEFFLSHLRLSKVRLVGILRFLQLVGIRCQVRLEFLKLTSQSAC